VLFCLVFSVLFNYVLGCEICRIELIRVNMHVDAWSVVTVYVQVLIKNDIFELTLSKPDGIVTGVRYNGVDNLMEILNKEDNRGY
jgi:hypothetical protein